MFWSPPVLSLGPKTMKTAHVDSYLYAGWEAAVRLLRLGPEAWGVGRGVSLVTGEREKFC